jgi:endonuclease YncB( thermonuclease family)
MTKFCPICGTKNETAAVRCHCGRVFEEGLKAALQSPRLADPRYYRKKQGIKKAGALLGIVTIVLFFTAYFAGAFPTQKQNMAEVSDEENRDAPLRPAAVAQPFASKPVFPQANVSYMATRAITGSILAVTDVSGQERRVTLLGIRVPKLDENFGAESKENLWRLIADKPIFIKPRKFTKEADTIAEVMVDGSNVSLAHLRSGLASIVPEELASLPSIEQQQYVAAVQAAKTAKYGIWSGQRPSDPLQQTAAQDISLPAPVRGFDSAPKRTNDTAFDPQIYESKPQAAPLAAESVKQKEKAPAIESVTENVTNETEKVAVPPPTGRKFIRGSRGGCYYFNSKGNKSYVDRIKCE